MLWMHVLLSEVGGLQNNSCCSHVKVGWVCELCVHYGHAKKKSEMELEEGRVLNVESYW